MDYSEKWGTDVETAVKLALDDLQLTIDEVDVTVLEEPSRGFFGIGSKLAKVRVEKKKPVKVEEKKQEAPAVKETPKAESSDEEARERAMNFALLKNTEGKFFRTACKNRKACEI